jgi:hypothetical protein
MESWMRRKFERRIVKIPVAVDTGGHGRHRSRMFDSRDICPSGVSVAAPDPLPVGTNVIVRMILPSNQRCWAQGVVWRHTRAGMVVKFDKDNRNIVDEFSYNEYLSGH